MNGSSSQSLGGAHPLARNVGEAPQARNSSSAPDTSSSPRATNHRPGARQCSMEIAPRVLPGEVFVYGRAFAQRGIDAVSRSAAPRFIRSEPATTSPPKRKRWDHPRPINAWRRFVE